MKNIFTIFLSIFLIVSCGKKTQSSQTKISFSGASSMLGSGPQMNGGIIVVGHRLDDSESFNIGLMNASDEQIIELIKGQWEFAAIGWEGSPSGVFTGANRCAYSGIMDLNTSNTAVTFNLDYATCANIPGHGAVITHPDFMSTSIAGFANQFKPVTVQTCSTLFPPITGLGSCAGIGLTRSVKIVAPGEKRNATGMAPLPSLQTVCMPLNATGILPTPLGLPVGNFINGKNENLMETMVLAFQSADCTGPPISYRFGDSMYVGINQPNLKAGAYSMATSTMTTLFLEHNTTTISSNIGYNPFGYGKDLDLVLNAAYQQPSTDYGQIVAIDPVGATVSIRVGPPPGTTGISFDDEIMWYVNSETTAGICGGGFLPGMFGFAHVKSNPIGTTPNFLLTLDHSITDYILSGTLSTPIPLAVPTTTNLSSQSCSMQIVRVPHYRSIITTAGAAAQINVYPMGGAGLPFGGLFPFKVSNELNIAGPFVINATATGAQVLTSSGCVSGDGKRCLKMGGSTGAVQGGGIVLSWINQINFSSATGSLLISADGATGGTTIGGFLNTSVNNIIYSGVAAPPSINQSVNGLPTNQGSLGVSYFKYCANTNAIGLPVVMGPGGVSQGCNF